MKIGIPKEIKNNENRVGMTPAGVSELVKHGHQVFGLSFCPPSRRPMPRPR